MFGIIKKIDIYVLKKFLLLFVGAFCICLFVLMMQAIWRYIDELIGKGLSLDILAKFFWYMGITLVPMSLPLSVLLTALISFGNMGESLELTAMKSAGIPLMRIMRPVIIVCLILMGVSFIFQNRISPNAQKQLTRMLATMKETSPAIEIPEGVFYNGIPNVNLYVQKKNAKTGMLYDIIIYKMDQGFENAQIVVADSGKLETTADKHFLQLSIYNGEQFENLRSTASRFDAGVNIPYDRETFKEKTLLIDFDTNFNMMDENMFSTMARVKDLKELKQGADSITESCDSIGRDFLQLLTNKFYHQEISPKDSVSAVKAAQNSTVDIRHLYGNLSMEKKLQTVQQINRETKSIKDELEWQYPIAKSGYTNARRHLIEWHQKFSFSLACLLFLFIGAPLGAIIRKGGLGVPTVVSVIIFIFYYIINTSGMKLAKEDNTEIWLGMWASTLVLMPFGMLLTVKANKDSVIFNIENYLNSIRHFFGFRQGRFFIKKEISIERPDYQAECERLEKIGERCEAYIRKAHLPHLPNYFKIFFKPQQEDDIAKLSDELEGVLERLSNTQNVRLLTYMNKYPELFTKSHLSPFHKYGINVALGLLFPIGIVLFWRIFRFRIRLYRDLKLIEKNNVLVLQTIRREELGGTDLEKDAQTALH